MIIITGTSSGIGKALTELYLSKNEKVIGIGRNQTIQHPNYVHLACDLSKPEEVDKLIIPLTEEPVTFIHNAGVLGKIGRFSELDSSSHVEVMQVNFNAGASLFHHLVEQIGKKEFTCVFVSSGAGKRPIASWASYCASKAAVDLFLETVQLEENEKEHSNIRVYAFSPGVVNTGMQESIRQVSKEVFSSVDRFIHLHKNKELKDTSVVANKISELIKLRPTSKVLWSITDFD